MLATHHPTTTTTTTTTTSSEFNKEYQKDDHYQRRDSGVGTWELDFDQPAVLEQKGVAPIDYEYTKLDNLEHMEVMMSDDGASHSDLEELENDEKVHAATNDDDSHVSIHIDKEDDNESMGYKSVPASDDATTILEDLEDLDDEIVPTTSDAILTTTAIRPTEHIIEMESNILHETLDFFTKLLANTDNSTKIATQTKEYLTTEHRQTPETLYSQLNNQSGNLCQYAILLGFCYEQGLGVEVDEQRAIEVYSKAADEGDMLSLYVLGLIHYYGRCSQSQDPKKAFTLFKKAAENGNVYAMTATGLCLWSGYGVERNATEAIKFYEMASKGQQQPSTQSSFSPSQRQGTLTLESSFGTGISPMRDHEKVFHYYKYLAERDTVNGDVQCFLGYCYQKGVGVEPNLEEAAKCYKEAADSGNAYGLYNFGLVNEFGWGVKKNEKEAIKLYTKAEEKGYQDAAKRNKSLSLKRASCCTIL